MKDEKAKMKVYSNPGLNIFRYDYTGTFCTWLYS
jgi:hypothetical protein